MITANAVRAAAPTKHMTAMIVVAFWEEDTEPEAEEDELLDGLYASGAWKNSPRLELLPDEASWLCSSSSEEASEEAVGWLAGVRCSQSSYTVRSNA